MSGICMQDVWNMQGICSDFAWSMYGIRMEYEWTMHGMSRKFAWTIICMGHVCNMHDICMEDVWNMHSVCVGYGWHMHGICVDNVWDMPGICLEYWCNMMEYVRNRQHMHRSIHGMQLGGEKYVLCQRPQKDPLGLWWPQGVARRPSGVARTMVLKPWSDSSKESPMPQPQKQALKKGTLPPCCWYHATSSSEAPQSCGRASMDVCVDFPAANLLAMHCETTTLNFERRIDGFRVCYLNLNTPHALGFKSSCATACSLRI